MKAELNPCWRLFSCLYSWYFIHLPSLLSIDVNRRIKTCQWPFFLYTTADTMRCRSVQGYNPPAFFLSLPYKPLLALSLPACLPANHTRGRTVQLDFQPTVCCTTVVPAPAPSLKVLRYSYLIAETLPIDTNQRLCGHSSGPPLQPRPTPTHHMHTQR